ncbi:MAG: glycosyltransferase [Candidatus Verstraetearchaeota archaeon]|nr:glycosyltransferase [Candidatus Verstraetearchaeota archaeon]
MSFPEDKKIVLFAAAKPSEKRKGVKYFFEALKYVQADDWMALAVGGAVDFAKWVPQGVEVRQLGYVKKAEDMAKVYSAADLYCITSLDDNFPTTVLESLACGTPVVGFRVGGIPEQVTEDCGILVELRDAQGLGKAITELLQDDVLRKKMSESCRARAVAEYSISKFRNRYVNVYNKAIEAGNNQES